MKHQDQPHERGKMRWRPRAEAFLRERKGEPFTVREFAERWGINREHARAQLSTLRRRGDLWIAQRRLVEMPCGVRHVNVYSLVLRREG